jgi:hypothetical protein
MKLNNFFQRELNAGLDVMPKAIPIPSGYTAKIDGNQITFEPVKPKYPTWEDAESNVRQLICNPYGKGNGFIDGVFTTLKRLQWLRNEWNNIDGFVVDWEDGSKLKYNISYQENKIFVDSGYHIHHFLYFGTLPTAQLFLDTFRDKIEVCKEFIN